MHCFSLGVNFCGGGMKFTSSRLAQVTNLARLLVNALWTLLQSLALHFLGLLHHPASQKWTNGLAVVAWSLGDGSLTELFIPS